MKSARSSRHRCCRRRRRSQHYYASSVFHHNVSDFVIGIVIILIGSNTGHFNIIGNLYVAAWKQCSPDDGGGICPTQNTCCPTGVAGISSCIPHRKTDEGPGECCDSYGQTGCGYGYYCSSSNSTTTSGSIFDRTASVPRGAATPTESHAEHAVCKILDPEHPPQGLNAIRTPRYSLCEVSSFAQNNTNRDEDVLALHGFPIPSLTEPTVSYNATYYSNRGNILAMQDSDAIQTVLIIVHGSSRNADDYFCAGLSLLNKNYDNNNNSNHNHNHQNTLVLAPKFFVDMDLNDFKDVDNPLYWDDMGGPDQHSAHTWRYGAEAENKNKDTGQTSGISSYDVMDTVVEYIIASKKKGLATTKKKSDMDDDNDDDDSDVGNTLVFPNVQKIVVMGHSAGGQYVHRWSLLSNSSIIWDNNNSDRNHNVDIRVVPANPRSYCYLDNRRMILKHEKKQKTVFFHDNDSSSRQNHHRVLDVPDSEDIDACPTYNSWEWGFERHSTMTSPYLDRALQNPRTSNDTATDDDTKKNIIQQIASRYGTRRNVYYLIGSNDTIDLDHDGCEQYTRNFQGYTRNERGHHYHEALQHYFHDANTTTSATATVMDHSISSSSTLSSSSQLIHKLFVVPYSPHDHTIMFQSKEGHEAIFGDGRNKKYATNIHRNGKHAENRTQTATAILSTAMIDTVDIVDALS